ncbi:hypothetical protein EI555_005776 [Monodon monoceros]|uniref:Ubiquitin-conjugating enzyme E2Q-like protein 1 n=1 Tax=Monodon monoceros TaxID=40151 RepID=A0A4U1F9M4_MONMO|nr:hypothetical protein EI555_005776 [Monodon monoceros]
MKELQDIARLSDRFISVELVDESLFDWNVKLHQVDKDSVLWQDMKETNTEFILLNLTFPDNFPFSPPFMRVLSPRLENGYVLDGGAICMELLTPRGWSSAYTVEAVMRQFAASLVKGQTPHSLDSSPSALLAENRRTSSGTTEHEKEKGKIDLDAHEQVTIVNSGSINKISVTIVINISIVISIDISSHVADRHWCRDIHPRALNTPDRHQRERGSRSGQALAEDASIWGSLFPKDVNNGESGDVETEGP